jgi:hypothetical protein
MLLVVVLLSAAAAQYCAAGMNAKTQLSLLSTVDFAGSGAVPECDLLMEPCTPCSDVWGLQVAGRDWAILSVTNGLQFVDVTDPKRPVKGAWLPGCLNFWRDMQVACAWGAFSSHKTGTGKTGAPPSTRLARPRRRARVLLARRAWSTSTSCRRGQVRSLSSFFSVSQLRSGSSPSRINGDHAESDGAAADAVARGSQRKRHRS